MRHPGPRPRPRRPGRRHRGVRQPAPARVLLAVEHGGAGPHRGQGIAKRLKAEMWQWLRDDEPQVTGLRTGNAHSQRSHADHQRRNGLPPHPPHGHLASPQHAGRHPPAYSPHSLSIGSRTVLRSRFGSEFASRRRCISQPEPAKC